MGSALSFGKRLEKKFKRSRRGLKAKQGYERW